MVRNKARESNNMVSVEESAGRGFKSRPRLHIFSNLQLPPLVASEFCAIVALNFLGRVPRPRRGDFFFLSTMLKNACLRGRRHRDYQKSHYEISFY